MTDCIVVGGGLVGALTASVLSAAGARVHLFERGSPGHDVGGSGCGVLSRVRPWLQPDCVTVLTRWTQDAFPDFIDDLEDYAGIDTEYQYGGVLVADGTGCDVALDWSTRSGIEVACLHGEVINQCVPAIDHPPPSAIFMPEIARINPARLMAALIRGLTMEGAKIESGREVVGLAQRGGRVTGVVTADGLFPAEQVVLASGAGAPGLLKSFGGSVRTKPFAEQVTVLRGDAHLLERVVAFADCYLVPRPEGRIVLIQGSESDTFRAGDVPATAIEHFPWTATLALEETRSMQSFGAASGIPCISQHPGLSGLFVNFAHLQTGAATGLAAAHLMLDLMTQRPPRFDPGPYSFEGMTASR